MNILCCFCNKRIANIDAIDAGWELVLRERPLTKTDMSTPDEHARFAERRIRRYTLGNVREKVGFITDAAGTTTSTLTAQCHRCRKWSWVEAIKVVDAMAHKNTGIRTTRPTTE